MTKSYRILVLLTVSLFSLGLASSTVYAQQVPSVRQEVTRRLKSIKPKDTKQFVYRVKVPVKSLALPSSVRLDLVYKIGHYSWDIVALRFERRNGSPYVDISQVVFSSAFSFIKDAMKTTDTYSVKRGNLGVREFDRLLTLAYTLYRSEIEQRYIGRSDMGFGSRTMSSGDGTILLQLAERRPHPVSILRESGTLHVGDLSKRVEGGYEHVRVHLFWQIFHEYLKTHSILNDMDTVQAVDLLIARLKEPSMVVGYEDYFRLSLYVNTLGELGSASAIQPLEYAAQSSVLEENWKKSLSEDICEAIEKIRAQSEKRP